MYTGSIMTRMKKNKMEIDNKYNMYRFNMQNFTKQERRLLMSKKLLLLALAAFLLVPLMASPAFTISADDFSSSANNNAGSNQERIDITTFPWTEDFEGTTFPPTDWYLYYPEPANEIIQDTTYNVTPGGSHCLRFSSYATDTTAVPYVQFARSPQIQLPSTMTYPTLEFFAKRYISFGTEELYMAIGTSTDVENWTGWIDVSSVIANDVDWHKITGDLSSLAGQNFYLGFKYYGDYQYYVGLDDVAIYDAAYIGGTVTLSGPEDVENVVITCGTKTTSPDSTGLYAFIFKNAGTYDMTADLPGYPQWTQTGVVATAGQATQVDISMTASSSYTLSGFIDGSDATGTGLDGAEISLSNDNFSYSGTTDASGNYSIANIVGNELLNVTISKDGYMPYSGTVTLTGDQTLSETLNEAVAVPGNVVATAQGSDMNITWDAVSDVMSFDSGVVTAQLGYQSGTYNSLMGTRFPYNAIVSEVTWQLTDNGGPHDNVKITILGLDATGTPDGSNVLYQSDLIANTDAQWNNHVLTTPIVVSGGFYVGVSYVGFLGLALDDASADTYVQNSQWVCADYTSATATWTNLTGTAYEQHFLVRAIGSNLGTAIATREMAVMHENLDEIIYVENRTPYNAGEPEFLTQFDRQLDDFNVYRFAEADMDNMANWTLLADDVTNTNYLDTTWNTMPAGIYYYAVSANYTSGTSEPTVSNWVAADMAAQVTVNVVTDSGDPVVGAEVTLSEVGGDHTYTANIVTGDVVTFPSVWRSNYDVSVSLDGHSQNLPVDNRDCTADSTHIVVLVEEDRMVLDYMTATVNNQAIDLEWFEVSSGFENVLLVDDDGSSYLDMTDVAPIYQALFTNLGINLTVHDVAAADADGPDAATMLNYDLVIWDTGEQWQGGNTLSDNDESNLSAYIDNGGKVIISGHDYLWDKYSAAGAFAATDFPNEYLGVASANQDAVTVSDTPMNINGATGSYVDGLSVSQTDIFTTAAAREGVYCDELVPNANGMAFATIDDGATNPVIAVQTSNTILFTGSVSGLVDGTNTVAEFMTAAMAGLSTATRNERAFVGYTIMRNGTELASAVQTTTYTDNAPLNGTNTYEVYALYTSGNSNTVTASQDFVGADDNINNFKDEVYGNYPNPFNPTTAIKFSLAKESNVEVVIYNIKGQKVKSLLNENRNAGPNSVVWNGTDDSEKSVGSGVYFYKIKTSSFSQINKMIMLK